MKAWHFLPSMSCSTMCRRVPDVIANRTTDSRKVTCKWCRKLMGKKPVTQHKGAARPEGTEDT